MAGSAPTLLDALEQDIAGLAHVRLGVVTGRRSFCDRSGDVARSEPFVQALCGAQALPRFSREALAAHLAEKGEADFPPHLANEGTQLSAGEAVLLTQNRADRAVQVARLIGRQARLFSLVELEDAVPAHHAFFRCARWHRGSVSRSRRAACPRPELRRTASFRTSPIFSMG